MGGRVSGGPMGGGGGQDEGEIRLRLGSAMPQLGEVSDEDAEDDASLVAANFASLTALLSVREATDTGSDELVRESLVHLHAALADG